MVLWFFHLSQWPPTSKDFYTRSYPLHFCPILILQREPVFLFLMLSFTTGTIFITSLVWHGPWLGIEPGTSRTRRQHSTTRLSRRLVNLVNEIVHFKAYRNQWPIQVVVETRKCSKNGQKSFCVNNIKKHMTLSYKIYQKQSDILKF